MDDAMMSTYNPVKWWIIVIPRNDIGRAGSGSDLYLLKSNFEGFITRPGI